MQSVVRKSVLSKCPPQHPEICLPLKTCQKTRHVVLAFSSKLLLGLWILSLPFGYLLCGGKETQSPIYHSTLSIKYTPPDICGLKGESTSLGPLKQTKFSKRKKAGSRLDLLRLVHNSFEGN